MITKTMIIEASKQLTHDATENKQWSLLINGKVYARSKGTIKAIRGLASHITGFPNDSASTMALANKLINTGTSDESWKGKKAKITLE